MKCISGKEWTTPDGQVLNTHPMFVKKISHKVCKIAKLRKSLWLTIRLILMLN